MVVQAGIAPTRIPGVLVTHRKDAGLIADVELDGLRVLRDEHRSRQRGEACLVPTITQYRLNEGR
jgi:hypothetical protein